MEDDEDVLFEGSPLYGHLKGAGFPEFEYETKTKDLHLKQKTDNNPKKPIEVEIKEKQNWYEFLRQQFRQYIYDDSWKEQIASLHKRTTDKILASAFKQPILSTEDAYYIENFSVTLDKESPTKVETASSIYGHILLQISVLVITISYGLMRMFCIKTSVPNIPSEVPTNPTKPSSTTIETTQSNLYIYGLDVVSLIVTIIALLPASIKFSATGKTLSHLTKLEGVFDQMLSNFHSFAKLSNKATLFIQESEVIKRGFTLLTVPISRLEQGLASNPEDRNYIDLRRSIFHRNRNILLAIRHTTTSILQLLPSTVELKGIKDCLAEVELSSFCNFIQDNANIAFSSDGKTCEQDGEVFKLTDGYSLASIKYLTQLTQAHMADLLRVVCLYACIRSDQLKRNKKDSSIMLGFESLTHILADLQTTFDKEHEPLKFYFEVCKNLRQAKETKGCNRQVVCEANRELKFVYMAVHSLLLHLQAAAEKVLKHDQLLEEQIETGKSDKDGDLMDVVLKDSEQLMKEISASKDCVQQLITFDARLKNNDLPGKVEDHSEETFEGVSNIVVSSDVTPVVQDEVFEIVTSNEREQREESKDFDDDVGGGRSMAGVLSELQSVISERAVIMAEREKIALGRFEEQSSHRKPEGVGVTKNDSGCDVTKMEGGVMKQDGGNITNKDDVDVINKCGDDVVKKEGDATKAAPQSDPWSVTHASESSCDKGARPKELRQYYGRLEEGSSDDTSDEAPLRPHIIHSSGGKINPRAFSSLHQSRNYHLDHNGFMRNNFRSGDIFKDVANMAASLGNSAHEEHYDNNDDDFVDDDEDDDDDEMDEEDDDDDIVSDSQSNDIDSDDIYHVTDDDEGFEGVNNACDYDDDDDGVHMQLNNNNNAINNSNNINNNININNVNNLHNNVNNLHNNVNNLHNNVNNLHNNTNDEDNINDNYYSCNDNNRAPISNHHDHSLGGVREHEDCLY